MIRMPIPIRTTRSRTGQKPAAPDGPSARSWRSSAARLAFVVLALLGGSTAAASAAGPFTVNTAADKPDVLPGDGLCQDAGGACSLRAAIEEASASGGPTTIDLPPGEYALMLGELPVGFLSATDITLNGTGLPADTLIVQTDEANRIFNVDYKVAGGVTFSVRNMTLQNGVGGAGGGGGAILAGGPGDVLNVANVVFANNRTSSFNGGAISFTGGGELRVEDSTFVGNQSPTGNGGAIHFVQTEPGSFQVTGSTFTGNVASGGGLGGQGGAINAGCTGCSPFSITHSNFSGNTADGAGTSGGQGGAIMVGSGTLSLHYNRIAGNNAPNGGTGVHLAGGSVAGQHNWWGCNGGPGAAGCDATRSVVGVFIVAEHWIVLSASADPTAIVIGQTATLAAGFLRDSNGGALAPGQNDALIGLPVSWGSAANGSLSGQQAAIQAGGTATAVFTASAAGAGGAVVTVDNATVSADVTVSACVLAPALVTITPKEPDVELTWSEPYAAYEVHSSEGDPYVAPGPGTYLGAGQGVFLHEGALAAPYTNHFYVVKTVCEGEALSNRTGVFHFGLTPGQ